MSNTDPEGKFSADLGESGSKILSDIYRCNLGGKDENGIEISGEIRKKRKDEGR